jgi:hypothetical protein
VRDGATGAVIGTEKTLILFPRHKRAGTIYTNIRCSFRRDASAGALGAECQTEQSYLSYSWSCCLAALAAFEGGPFHGTGYYGGGGIGLVLVIVLILVLMGRF